MGTLYCNHFYQTKCWCHLEFLHSINVTDGTILRPSLEKSAKASKQGIVIQQRQEMWKSLAQNFRITRRLSIVTCSSHWLNFSWQAFWTVFRGIVWVSDSIFRKSEKYTPGYVPGVYKTANITKFGPTINREIETAWGTKIPIFAPNWAKNGLKMTFWPKNCEILK